MLHAAAAYTDEKAALRGGVSMVASRSKVAKGRRR
jgi:hypothetical protein